MKGDEVIRRRPNGRLNTQEREMMRRACRFNAELLDFVRPRVQEGVTTEQIDQWVYEYTMDHGHIPACLGYMGEAGPYPKSSCTSINEVICHGIPSDYELKSGDIVNVDLTTIVEGWHGDQSETFIIGDGTQEAIDVVQCAFDSLYLAIDALTPGCAVSVIGDAVVERAKIDGFGVVDKYVGHGIGRNFHQRPNIPHVPNRQSRREYLFPGMCFTIEPMINVGTPAGVCDKHDGWTVRTKDGKLSAQFEHTILMNEDGPEILTMTNDGPKQGHKFGG